MQTNNKTHWYDGRIYSALIAPNQRSMFKKIINEIPNNSRVIDIACGTGEFSILASEKMSSITGIDLSSANIDNAIRRAEKSGFGNIDFIHFDALKIQNYFTEKFDYAIITFALHEMPHIIRKDVLMAMRAIADNVIIGDYSVPQPFNFYGAGVRMIEFFAGIEHFKGFLSYNKYGGIEYYTRQANLKTIKTISAHKGHSEIVFCR
jgi:SAM-dependent methyltransferase